MRPASSRAGRATVLLATWSGARRRRGQRGAVTAETALVLPLLVAVAATLCWVLAVGAAQVRTVDAAREAARALARGDDPAVAQDVARRVAPPGARVVVAVAGGEVTARVTAHLDGPGGLLGALPGARVSAEAVALAEDGP